MSEIHWAQLLEESLDAVAVQVLPPTLKLPALPVAVSRFVERANDADVPIRELAAILETDTGLTLELLKQVNSAFCGLRHSAKTVQQAITLLGLRQTKNFVFTSGTEAAIRAKRSKLINQACFWNSSLQKALFAREVARLLKTDADAAFAGGLLQDYLLPVLTNQFFEEYVTFADQRAVQPRLLNEFETQVIGRDHAQIGAALAYRWHLPDELVCCILFHHGGLSVLTDDRLRRTPVAAVALSALLPDQLRQTYDGLEQLSLLQESWPAFDLEALVAKVDEAHQQMDIGVGNAFPLARRCRSAMAVRGGVGEPTMATGNELRPEAMAQCAG